MGAGRASGESKEKGILIAQEVIGVWVKIMEILVSRRMGFF
jgi:hypothetical protein